MTIHLHNTLTRAKAPFAPLDPANVRMYVCGPTVYDFAHIGNWRTFVFADLVRRTLQFRGYEVAHVMNITDVVFIPLIKLKTRRGKKEKERRELVWKLNG